MLTSEQTAAAHDALERVRLRVEEKLRKEKDFHPGSASETAGRILVDLCSDLLHLVWLVLVVVASVLTLLGKEMAPVWWIVAIAGFLAAVALEVVVRRWKREYRHGSVLLAQVVQCFMGGWEPVEDVEGAPPFTGICVFSFDDRFTLEGYRAVVDLAARVKHADDPVEWAELSEMLRKGDTTWAPSSLAIPERISGVPRTHVAGVMWDRKDLPQGYLAQRWVFLFVDEETPSRVSPLPGELWEDVFLDEDALDDEPDDDSLDRG